MNLHCPNCKKKGVNFIDNYKFEIKSDEKFIGNPKIYGCDDCRLFFANPMPDKEKLDKFYETVYQAPGRDLYFKSYDDIKDNFKKDKNLNYLLYLTIFIDFKKIQNILEFGAGTGDLGYLIKKVFNHINLYSCEKDLKCLEILKLRSYNNLTQLDNVNEKFDLIISLHNFHHLANLEIIPKLKKSLKKGGHLFFEVPNCEFDKNYINRSSDSPHLIFFTKLSWEKILILHGFKKINLSNSSYSINKCLHFMESNKKRLYNWELKPSNFSMQKIKSLIKKITPKPLLKIRKMILNSNEYKDISRPEYFVNNQENSWAIRGILQKNSD